MTKIISIEEYKQQKAVENMVVPCGPKPKIQVTWTPKIPNEQMERIRTFLEKINRLMKEIKDAGKV